MATQALDTSPRANRRNPWAPTTYDKCLAAGSMLMLVAVVAALARGRAEWGQVPAVVWLHIATILVALALTPVMMLRPRGDRLH